MSDKSLREFQAVESTGGIALFTAALLAFVVCNSPWQSYYETFVSHNAWLIEIINNGLMAIFFLLVGLEIKREVLNGELNSISKITLPAVAAVGGMLMPALIYCFFNYSDSNNLRGWAVPTATDIAFALGVLSLLGSRIPLSLKVFLSTLAIFDDLGAILIIAIYYAHGLNLYFLALAFGCLLVLIFLNKRDVNKLALYLFFGFLLWLCLLKSGIHPTIAGVMLAFTIPYNLLSKLEKQLHPWVAFLILPIFAFANAGVSLVALQLEKLITPIPLGIMLGLFLGKQIGVFGSSWLAIKLGFASLPKNADWKLLYGVALLCGVGFTMSLFIGSLAFDQNLPLIRVAIIIGSCISGIISYLILRFRH